MELKRKNQIYHVQSELVEWPRIRTKVDSDVLMIKSYYTPAGKIMINTYCFLNYKTTRMTSSSEIDFQIKNYVPSFR